MNLKIIDRLISSSDSWKCLYDDLCTNKEYSEKFKGDVFERLTQAYLLTMPEYKSILKEVWLYDDVPKKVLDKLALPSKDFGIDLIAATKNNEYWSVQSKFKSPNQTLRYSDLTSFSTLSFSKSKNISLGIISHTSTKPIRNKKLLGNITELGSGRWKKISDNEWGNIRNFCQQKPIKLKKRKKRKHQIEVISAASDYFVKNKNNRGKLIMPCATGKSLSAFWIAQSLKSKKIIVAVPSLALIKQSLNDWTKEYMAHGIIPEWLCVCSDKSTGEVDIDEFDSDVYDLGIPTTTNLEKITKFIKKRSSNPKIIFVTYQSSPKLASASTNAKANFDLAILDEAHKTVGVKKKKFSTLLFDEKIKIKKRLFMTATERFLRGSDDEVVSMKDKNIYGTSFYTMTFKEAIERDIISDYKILTIAVSDSQVSQLIEDNKYLYVSKKNKSELGAQNLAAGIALKKTYKEKGIKHAISFHRTIGNAKDFQKQQDQLNKIQGIGPKVTNLHISSKKSTGERAELIEDFKDKKRSLITNARCLTEGVDVPAIDSVIFVDPKQSVIDIVQAAGRALRKYDGKDFGYIILPIVVPDNMEVEEFAETTPFKTITKIIASLSTQDERIAEEFRLEKNAKSSKGKIIQIDTKLKIGMKIDIEKFSEKINTKIWEKVGKINFREFKFAREYARSLKLSSQAEWRDFCSSKKMLADIPKSPDLAYKNKGWISWNDWLDHGYIATQLREYKSYKDARKYMRSQGLKNQQEWNRFKNSIKMPPDIPKTPHTVYKEWINLGDWLGTGTVATNERKYKSYDELKKYVQSLKISTSQEWFEFCKNQTLPPDVPRNLPHVYKSNWKGWGDVTGTNRIYRKKFLPFKDARSRVRKKNFKSAKEFGKWKNKPKNIPYHPERNYKKDWNGWGDWLGTGNIATRGRSYRPFKDARKFVRKQNLKNQKEWYVFIGSKKRPNDIPSVPERIYKEWINLGDWLGTFNVQGGNKKKTNK